MKIKNDYIIINHNGKQTKLHNTILNTYLYWLISNQTNIDEDYRASLSMSYVYIKFDEQLTFDKTSVLEESNFNIKIPYFNSSTQITPTQIIRNYFYKADNSQYTLYDIQDFSYLSDMSSLLNRKITAIGFGGTQYGNNLIYACVDTSNYNLYIESMDTVFSIARRDTITTDAIFYCSSKLVKGPVHLCDGQDVYVDYFPQSQYIGMIESIGLGLTTQRMDQEISLKPYTNHLSYETNKILINDEFTIEYYSEGLFPAEDLYPSEDLYPARVINEPIYPSEDIYPGIDLYMIEAPYQYMQLKYEIYSQDNITGVITDTGKYYLLSMPVNGKEKIKMNIEYES